MRLCVKYIERKEVSKITLILLPFQEKAFSEKIEHPKNPNNIGKEKICKGELPH